MKIVLVVGARPNFVKIAPIIAAMEEYNNRNDRFFDYVLVHTGQHYDYNMSKLFFEDLNLPEPDIFLQIGSGTHAEQTGKIIIKFEKVLLNEIPALVLVVGDVNSTIGAALAAVKLNIPVAHVEAGMRSFDKTMPEEVNRVLTDHVSDFLFTTSKYDDENLKNEGIGLDKIFCVGNTTVDCLLSNLEKARHKNLLDTLNLTEYKYALLTLHRASNVDVLETLESLLSTIKEVSKSIQVVFPVHPRTRKRIIESGLLKKLSLSEKDFIQIDPLGYLNFICLMMKSKFVMTDSGGIQSETTILNVPCLTLRDSTEWKVTIDYGTNILVGEDPQSILASVSRLLFADELPNASQIPLWEGKSAERIVDILARKAK